MKLLQKFDSTFFETQCISVVVVVVGYSYTEHGAVSGFTRC